MTGTFDVTITADEVGSFSYTGGGGTPELFIVKISLTKMEQDGLVILEPYLLLAVIFQVWIGPWMLVMHI